MISLTMMPLKACVFKSAMAYFVWHVGYKHVWLVMMMLMRIKAKP